MTSVTSSTSTITSPYATVKEQIRPGRFESNEKEYGTLGAAVMGVGDAVAEGASATVSLSEKALNAVEEGASYIGNAVQVFFKDGTSTARVAVDFPIGHRKRRAEGMPVLVKKFESSVDAWFSPKQAERVKAVFADPKLDQMPVNELVAAMVTNGVG